MKEEDDLRLVIFLNFVAAAMIGMIFAFVCFFVLLVYLDMRAEKHPYLLVVTYLMSSVFFGLACGIIVARITDQRRKKLLREDQSGGATC